MTLDPRITFSRASLGTYYGSDGLLKYAAHNNFWWSEDLTQAQWGKATSVTITADATTAPDGATTADRLNHTSAGTTSATYVSQSISPLWADRCIVSVYAKAGSKSFLMIGSSAVTAAFQIWFNLATGALGTVGAGAGVISGAIEDVGGGWYRCSALMTQAGWGSLAYFRPGETNGSVNCTSPGDIYLWGAQAEYITTATTPSAYKRTPAAAPYHAPRFDYDPITHQPRGLLIEQSSQINTTWSQDLTNAIWAKTGSTAAANQIVAPDGTTTGGRVTASASPAIVSFATTTTNGASYVQSFYAKKGTADWIYTTMQQTADAVGTPRAWFNLATGAVGTVESPITATIQDVGNGWFRCTARRVAGTTSTARVFAVGPSDANGSATVTVGKSIHLWGTQLETGVGGIIASSYMPITSTLTNRAADVAVMTGTNFSSWYNQSAGTFVVAFTLLTVTGTRGILSADNNTTAESIRLYGSGTDPKVTVIDGGATQADLDAGTIAANAPYKLGGSVAANDIAACLNGGTVATDTTATMPTPTQLRIGNESATAANTLNGYLRSLRFYNVAKSDAELQTLTT